MDVYVKEYKNQLPFSAWNCINRGYANAWLNMGYNVIRYSDFSEIKESGLVMAGDFDLHSAGTYVTEQIIDKSKKLFIFGNPNMFPTKFNIQGSYTSLLPVEYIQKLNRTEKVVFWTFCETRDRFGNEYFYGYDGKIMVLPLAFDNFQYKEIEDDKWKYDVCFCGKFVNNGVFGKEKIMKDWIYSLEGGKIKCGFFGAKENINMDDEVRLLYNSKIALNTHDEYQILLGLDSNERTFKSLGLNGFLICDRIWQLEKMTELNIIFADSSREYKQCIEKYLETDIHLTKEENKRVMLEKHTYTIRVRELEKLI